MTATNHIITGVMIASVVRNPVLALPLALASHFVLDALPHYSNRLIGMSSTTFKLMLAGDIYIGLMCLGLVYFSSLENMWLLIFGGVVAASPDLMWLPDFIAANKHTNPPVYGPIRRFHERIQWYAKPNGAWFELGWFILIFLTVFVFTIN